MNEIKIKIVDGGMMPQYQRQGDVCMDCHARTVSNFVVVEAGCRQLVDLGFILELPENYEAVIRPRSGLTKQGIDIGIGTIDTNYRGEVKACVINNTDEPFIIRNGDRVCQMAVRKCEPVVFVAVEEVSTTERGDNGFGSSGK